ncbi:dephospho-CoA kinase [Nocardioides insulae]|uniref:dephospho-CoA kinase n=1 Tax=Nocardioides insulae TaxID=394734 RepID=UPI00048D0D51|nr:dephospho-CoA kinase [Nocardioides insulae]
MRVGLTGGIGAGKSAVASMLAELGAVIVDADRLAREVVAAGTPGLDQVVEAFGPEVLTTEGEMDRAAVGALVFADETKRAQLEGIIHPLVRARGAQLEGSAGEEDIVVHDIPLLVETGQADRFDAVLVVDADDRTRVTRLVEHRGMTEDEARARFAAQASRAERLAAATYVLDNSGTLEDLRQQVAEVFDQLRVGSSTRSRG